jgi:hypothetical protein
LVLTPMSSVSALSYLIRSNVPLSDLEEMVIRIGVKEVRNFLRIQALVIHSNVFSLAYIILILICILCNCRDSAY